jgi:SNF2 family DNA or RNA helicase
MKTQGMTHQITGLALSEGKRNFAFLLEQGCGKTWLTLADAERCFIGNKIDAIVVVAPNGVHSNWTRREIPTHLSIPVCAYTWNGKPTTKKALAEYDKIWVSLDKNPNLRVLAINVEAVNTEAGYDAVEKFIACFRVMFIVDESTRIKNPGAKRTEKVIKLGRQAIARRILTGTPITKAPTDIFSQFDFLKSGLLGTTSYRAFVAEYAVLLDPGSPQMQAIMRKVGGRGVPQVVAEDAKGNKMWRNLDKLAAMIAPHSYRVRKEDCLDLPPKVYQTITFELDSKQRQVYDRLKEDYHYDNDGDDMSFEAIATRTKLKQVTSGFINVYGEPQLLDVSSNPRMAAFKTAIEDVDGQFIVWAMFEEEIKHIIAALEDAGISFCTYYGATSKQDRELAIDDFQAGRKQGFVGHAGAAGIGITLTAARTAFYYSCSFDNELRLQSEDRNHRIGTTSKVLYVDFVAENTIDEDIVKSLATKNAIAWQVIDKDRGTIQKIKFFLGHLISVKIRPRV